MRGDRDEEGRGRMARLKMRIIIAPDNKVRALLADQLFRASSLLTFALPHDKFSTSEPGVAEHDKQIIGRNVKPKSLLAQMDIVYPPILSLSPPFIHPVNRKHFSNSI